MGLPPRRPARILHTSGALPSQPAQRFRLEGLIVPLTLSWAEIALRLGLTVVAGLVIGINRSERGRAAGVRTNLLVCLAASVAMLQANLLLNTTGKASNSFVVLDLMRFPLGILTGIGFIGGGVILRRDSTVIGVTTAATLWMVTVIGLCFGGGQLGLGAAATGLAVLVLWSLQRFERWLQKERRATLVLSALPNGPSDDEIRGRLVAAGYRVETSSVTYNQSVEPPRRTLRCQLGWSSKDGMSTSPTFVEQFARHPGVVALQWRCEP